MNFRNQLMKSAMEELAIAEQQPTSTISEADKAKHQQDAVSADEQKKHREDEIVFYAKMTNPEGLKLANAKEHHEQWEIKTKKGKVRVRKTTKDGLEPTYSMTFKTKSSNAGIEGSTEQENPSDAETFNNFKEIATSGMIKDRFLFPVTSVQIKAATGTNDIDIKDIFYEVDVFFNADDTHNLYIKIDLEMNAVLNALQLAKPDLGEFKLNVKLMDLPFKPTEIICNHNLSDEDKAKVDKLYEEVFITKNRG